MWKCGKYGFKAYTLKSNNRKTQMSNYRFISEDILAVKKIQNSIHTCTTNKIMTHGQFPIKVYKLKTNADFGARQFNCK